MPRALRRLRKASSPGDLRAVVDETIALYHRLMWVADQIHEHGGATARRGILRGLLRYGPQSVPDLARARAVRRQSIQPVVDELVGDGLVVLEANPKHRTSKLVRITPAGAAIVERMDRVDRRVLTAVGRDLDRADIEVTARTLRGLRNAFRDDSALAWRRIRRIIAAMTTPIEQIPVKTIDGADASLGTYAGHVRLVVNVASKCGLTPQYEALEKTYRKYKDKGFEVLGFPANEFGAQEPGTEAEIKDFCSSKYDVSFPMFSKIVVKGEGQHPLYKALTKEQPNAKTLPGDDFKAKLEGYGVKLGAPDEIMWNFEKFLVDKHGKVVERFAPSVAPDSELITKAIESALA